MTTSKCFIVLIVSVLLVQIYKLFLVSAAVSTQKIIKIISSTQSATIKFATTTTQPTAEQIAQIKAQITQTAMLDGITYTFFIAAGITVLALILSLFIKRVDVTKREDYTGSVKETK